MIFPKHEWIDVEDALPPLSLKGGRDYCVLVFEPAEGWSLAVLGISEDAKPEWRVYDDGRVLTAVTHWMAIEDPEDPE